MDGLPELVMRRDTLSDLPPVSVEFGYLLRTYRPGDGTLWCSIASDGADGVWTPARFKAEILESPHFDPRSILFITLGSRPAGAAAVLRPHGDGGAAVLHLVAVRKEHRRKGIGRFLIVKALEYARSSGSTACTVRADGRRAEAIKLCLEVGFRPEYRHETHRTQWEEICRKIGWPAAELA